MGTLLKPHEKKIVRKQIRTDELAVESLRAQIRKGIAPDNAEKQLSGRLRRIEWLKKMWEQRDS